MEQVWDKIDVLLISSRAEGLPMVALEALAHGIPVVANRVGALPEVLEQGLSGWLYNGNLDNAVRCLSDFLATRGLRGQGLATDCRARIARSFSVDRGLDRILGVYRQAGLAEFHAEESRHQSAAVMASTSRQP
jgi:glycosyltransferase involved in cell wall biosynthesis